MALLDIFKPKKEKVVISPKRHFEFVGMNDDNIVGFYNQRLQDEKVETVYFTLNKEELQDLREVLKQL